MADFDDIPQFDDFLFRQKRKHGKFRVVPVPLLAQNAANIRLADSHAHVHLLDDPVLELTKAQAWGVQFICCIVDICEDDQAVFNQFAGWLKAADKVHAAYVLTASEQAVAQAELMPNVAPIDCLPAKEGFAGAPTVRFAVGCHPHNAKLYSDEVEQQLRKRLADPQVSAVGEIGLDYHYDLSPRDVQREVFRRQIRLAHELQLPIALHVREAHDEAFEVLQEEGFPQAGTLLHCFDLDWETLKPWIEAGCYVAFGGALTFKRCEDTREALTHVPLDRLLVETDSHYMAPEPVRGMPCNPAHTLFTVAKMQEVLGCETNEQKLALLDQLWDNTQRLLNQAR